MRKEISAILLTCLMIFSGCAGLKPAADAEFEQADRLKSEKKYFEAAIIYAKIAREAAGTERGARALFAEATARASFDNPQKDYAAALQKFEDYIRRYPGNERSHDAQNWRSALKTILDLRKENEQLTKNIEELKKVDIRHEERRKGKRE